MSDHDDDFLLPDIGRETMAIKRSRLKRKMENLRRNQWQPGQSGNPNGRPAAGMAVQEWINLFYHQPDKYDLGALEAIIYSTDAPMAAKTAANQVLTAARPSTIYEIDKNGYAWPAGTDPEVGKAFDRIMDRTIGKALQRTKDETPKEDRPPDEIEAELLALLRSERHLFDLLVSKVAQTRNPSRVPVENLSKQQSLPATDRSEAQHLGEATTEG